MQDEAAKIVGKKAYEIGYALCRVAAHVCLSAKDQLEGSAFRITEASASLNIHELRGVLGAARNHVRLAGDTGIINRGNADLILSEIGKLESFLQSAKELESGKRVDIENAFSSYPAIDERKRTKREDVILKSQDKGEKDNEIEGERIEDRQSAENRQSGMLEFVKKTGNCRMKDLIEQFPLISERTIRYDLQTLLGKGLIERSGEGGPGTYYRQKPNVSEPSPMSANVGEVHPFGASNL